MALLPSFGWFPRSHTFACHVFVSVSVLAALSSAFHISCFVSHFLCLGSWSLMGLVRDEDVLAIARLDEVEACIELEKLGNVLKTHRG